jgi:hypothetical protein
MQLIGTKSIYDLGGGAAHGDTLTAAANYLNRCVGGDSPEKYGRDSDLKETPSAKMRTFLVHHSKLRASALR